VLCRDLAARGYAVAALDHSETFVPELMRRDDETPEHRAARIDAVIANRVPDVLVLLDVVLRGACGAPVALDAERVGLAGHSFGGWTVLATPDTDERVRSIVAHAPGGGRPIPPGIVPAEVDFAWRRPIPLFVVADLDASLPLPIMHELFARAPEPKRLVVLPNTDHLHFGDDVETHHEAVRAMFASGPLAHLQTAMRPIAELTPGAETQRTVSELTAAHFDTTLRGDAA